MKHPADQDLLMLAHRSLDPFKAIATRWHLTRCADCRRRYSEFGALSTAVASAIRIGLPAWKPIVLALKTKLLAAVILLAAGILVTEVVVSNRVNTGACQVTEPTVLPRPMMVPLPPKHLGTPRHVGK